MTVRAPGSLDVDVDVDVRTECVAKAEIRIMRDVDAVRDYSRPSKLQL